MTHSPAIATPKGTSFGVGEMSPEDRAGVPLAMVKPLILRPVLMDPEVIGDPLKLTQLFAKRLREESATVARGGGTVVYVDAEELPGAIQPKGTYTVDGNTVTVRLVLWRDGEKAATVPVEGTKDRLAKLVEKLAVEMGKAL